MVSQGKAPRYRCHLGRILLKMPAISLLTGPPWGATWQMFNLTLTPSAAAECEAIAFGSDPAIDCGGGAGAASHVCLRCAGELRFGLVQLGLQLISGLALAVVGDRLEHGRGRLLDDAAVCSQGVIRQVNRQIVDSIRARVVWTQREAAEALPARSWVRVKHGQPRHTGLHT